jgi:tetratricopeptide (TPR) repeat protein
VAVTIRRAVTGIAADVDLIRKGDAQPVWHDHVVEADALGVLRSTTEKVASALEGHYAGGRTMTEAKRTQLRQLPTRDGEALSSYLKGRTVLDGSEVAETDQAAADLFESAIKRDGSFALAHAGLSLAYISRAKNTEEPSWLDRAARGRTGAGDRSACDQALLASALGFRASRKKDNAVLDARQAVALTPDSDDARRVLGLALIDQGTSQAGAALAELRRAIALRPSHWINHSTGQSLLVLNEYQAGIDELQQVKQNLPASNHLREPGLRLAARQLDQAVGHLERAIRLNGKDHYAPNNLATAAFLGSSQQALVLQGDRGGSDEPETLHESGRHVSGARTAAAGRRRAAGRSAC